MEHGRRSWRLAECLIVGVATLVVLALIVPGILQSRSLARLSQCKENLLRLGLALHGYHDSHGVLPPGIVATTDPINPGVPEFVAATATCDRPEYSQASGLMLLLPRLEAREAYAQYNHRVACCAMANASAVSHPVAAYLCPGNSRTGPAQPWGYYQKPQNFSGAGGPAATDYVFAAGGMGLLTWYSPFCIPTGARRVGFPGQFKPGSGAFHVNSSTHFGMIKDGLTNTALIGESVSGMPLGVNAGGFPADGVEPIVAADPRRVVSQAWSQGYVSDRRGFGGYGSVFAVSAFNAWYNNMNQLTDPRDQQLLSPKGWKQVPVNEGGAAYARGVWMASSTPSTFSFYNCGGKYDGSAVIAAEGSSQGWRSVHPRAVPLLFGDGSVRLVGDDIDPQLLVGLTSFRGGEIVDLPEVLQ